jgi:hypothetical protein
MPPTKRRDVLAEPSLIAGTAQAIIDTYSVDTDERMWPACPPARWPSTWARWGPDLYAAVGVPGLPQPASANDLSSALAAMKGDFRRSQPEKGTSHCRSSFHGDRDTTVHSGHRRRSGGAGTPLLPYKTELAQSRTATPPAIAHRCIRPPMAPCRPSIVEVHEAGQRLVRGRCKR